jgi:hypothetical protein
MIPLTATTGRCWRLLLTGAPVGGGGCCAGLIAMLLCGGIGLGAVCQFLQDQLQRLLHLFP